MKSKNVRTYDDEGNMFGAYHVEGVENRDADDAVVYAWSFIDGKPSSVVWVGRECFDYA